MTKNDPEKTLLVVDDEVPLARAIAKRYEREGYRSIIAETLREARTHLGMNGRRGAAIAPSLVVLDMRLPDGSGLDLISEICDGSKSVPVIVLTAFGDLENAVEAMKRGASDYLRKPVDLDELTLVTDRVLRTAALETKLQLSRTRESAAHDDGELIGACQQINDIREQIKAFATMPTTKSAPARPILLLGETGTGKEVAARLLHRTSGAGDQPFVQVDCTAFASEDLERQLFGFTAPDGTRQTGLIEAAESGTMFLDEVGDLPLDLQGKLLHVVERHSIRQPTGGDVGVRARLIAASNRPLASLASSGEFRSDLYYRLNALTITMPPVRERQGDARLLAEHFARQTARRFGRPKPRFAEDALTAIDLYSWPGNVWEIKHVVERGVLLSHDQPIAKNLLGIDTTASAPRAARTADTPVGTDSLAGMTLEGAERMLIVGALRKSGGNVSRAARMLGVTRMAMRYRIEKHGISLSDPAQNG